MERVIIGCCVTVDSKSSHLACRFRGDLLVRGLLARDHVATKMDARIGKGAGSHPSAVLKGIPLASVQAPSLFVAAELELEDALPARRASRTK
jgi:hypothetical protein